jgi:hypothetical protein
MPALQQLDLLRGESGDGGVVQVVGAAVFPGDLIMPSFSTCRVPRSGLAGLMAS